jgi:hypothetical protein
MRSFELAAFAPALALTSALALCGWGCAVPLHDDGDESSSGGDAGGPPPLPPPVASGCLALKGVPGVDSFGGAVRTILRSDGGALLVADDARAAGNDVPSPAFVVPPSATIADCFAAATPAQNAIASALDASLAPLSGVATTDAGTLLFVDQFFTGNGVTMLDPAAGVFRASGGLLWTSDRPGYGTAVVESSGALYVYGCLGARFLDADCYVARVAPTSAADQSAYAYYTGGGQWSPRIEDAWPTTSGGTTMDVAFIPSANRWLMAYSPPLSTTLRVRSGVAPEGPWSAPIDLATCDLADPDMFCGGVHLHPALTRDAGTIVLSYGAATLSSDAGARRVAEPEKWWPRFAVLSLPSLP